MRPADRPAAPAAAARPRAIRATFFTPGYNAERWPDAVRAIRDAGHEIAHHGCLHEGWRRQAFRHPVGAPLLLAPNHESGSSIAQA